MRVLAFAISNQTSKRTKVKKIGSGWLNQLLILWEETFTYLGELSTGFCLLLLLIVGALNHQGSGRGPGWLYLVLATELSDTTQSSS